jgi:uncharacterized protein YcgI (DUF1989 family)
MPEKVQVPAREGKAVRIDAGRRFRVIDVKGNQIADTWAFCADDIGEYQSAGHTRAYLSRLFPRVGEHFVTNRRRPILLFEQDNSPGIHDMLLAACDPTRYKELGVDDWHASCQENLQKAMAEVGYERTEIPQPMNFFMNTPALADGSIDWRPAPTGPGDSVVLRAELDIFLAVSSCPQDIIDINEGTPTPIEIEILDS